MGFKPSQKVLVALRGFYNLPFNLDDPVFYTPQATYLPLLFLRQPISKLDTRALSLSPCQKCIFFKKS